MSKRRTFEIEEFILSYLVVQAGESVELDSSTNFVDSGMLDSFAILNMIMALESEYAIKFQPQELADPSIRVVSALASLVVSKLD